MHAGACTVTGRDTELTSPSVEVSNKCYESQPAACSSQQNEDCDSGQKKSPSATQERRVTSRGPQAAMHSSAAEPDVLLSQLTKAAAAAAANAAAAAAMSQSEPLAGYIRHVPEGTQPTASATLRDNACIDITQSSSDDDSTGMTTGIATQQSTCAPHTPGVKVPSAVLMAKAARVADDAEDWTVNRAGTTPSLSLNVTSGTTLPKHSGSPKRSMQLPDPAFTFPPALLHEEQGVSASVGRNLLATVAAAAECSHSEVGSTLVSPAMHYPINVSTAMQTSSLAAVGTADSSIQLTLWPKSSDVMDVRWGVDKKRKLKSLEGNCPGPVRSSRRMQNRVSATHEQGGLRPVALRVSYPFQASGGGSPSQQMVSLDMTAAVASALAVDTSASSFDHADCKWRKALLSEDSRRAAIASGEHLISIRSVGQAILNTSGLSRRDLFLLPADVQRRALVEGMKGLVPTDSSDWSSE